METSYLKGPSPGLVNDYPSQRYTVLPHLFVKGTKEYIHQFWDLFLKGEFKTPFVTLTRFVFLSSETSGSETGLSTERMYKTGK